MEQRLFIASLIPRDIALALSKEQAECGLCDIKPCPAENLHITYAFLGKRDIKALPAIFNALSLFNLALLGVKYKICLPLCFKSGNVGRGGAIALKVELSKDISGALAMLSKRLLLNSNFAFIPHITIGRAKTKASCLLALQAYKRHFSLKTQLLPLPKANLFSSTLSSAGAVYKLLIP